MAVPFPRGAALFAPLWLLASLLPSPARAANATPHDPAEAERFFDGLITRQMQEAEVRGLVLAFVSRGRVVLLKGYGHSDLAGMTPVSAHTTLFPVGSITKVVTATAAMQQVERGRLDLYRDVNDYLRGTRIRQTYSEPITLAHLLTHTSGFDENNIGAYVHLRDEAPTLAERIALRMPRRIRPAGYQAGYANYNFDLVGRLVELASNVPFDRYLRENVFGPLDMRCSGLGEVGVAGTVRARGIVRRPGGRHLAPETYDDSPGFGLVTTGHDMANLLLAHLGRGRFGDRQILQESTVRLMHQRHFAPHPRLPGYGLGTYECLRNDQRALVQGGAFPGAISLLLMLPEHEVGLFVAYNNSDPLRYCNAEIVSGFLNHYYPPRRRELTPPCADGSLARFAGTYGTLRHSRFTPEKVVPLLSGQVVVRQKGDRLLIDGQEWTCVEPGLFRRGDQLVAFEEDGHGAVTHLHLDDVSYERLPWYETLAWHVLAFATCSLLFAGRCLGALASVIRKYFAPGRNDPPILGRVKCESAILATINLTFVVGMFLHVRSHDHYDYLFGLPLSYRLISLLPAAAGGLVLSLAVGCALLIRLGQGSRFERLCESAFVLINAGFLGMLINLKLLG